MTRRSVKTKKIIIKNPRIKKAPEITNKLFQEIQTIWQKYALLPGDVYVMRDMMVAFRKLGLKEINMLLSPSLDPNVPRLRFTHRNKTYVWCYQFMLEEKLK